MLPNESHSFTNIELHGHAYDDTKAAVPALPTLIWFVHMLCQLPVLVMSVHTWPLADAWTVHTELKGPLAGQVKLLVEENAVLQVCLTHGPLEVLHMAMNTAAGPHCKGGIQSPIHASTGSYNICAFVL